ncbi:MAG TPA: hypothetical protein VLG47_03355 [Candidatus Saccharimonadales bacterium]|nr:hypothetical protein [Candidatus Saccharimonadales bacterium]
MTDPFLHDGPYPGPFVPNRIASRPEASSGAWDVQRLVGHLLTSSTIELEVLPNYNREELDGLGIDPSEYNVFTVPMAKTETEDEQNGRISQHITALIFSGSEAFSVITLNRWSSGETDSPTMQINLADMTAKPLRARSGGKDDGIWVDQVDVLFHYGQTGEAELIGILQKDARHEERYVIPVDGVHDDRIDSDVRFTVEKMNESHVLVTDLPSWHSTSVVARRRLRAEEINPEPSVEMLGYPDNALTEHPDVWKIDASTIARIYAIKQRIDERALSRSADS